MQGWALLEGWTLLHVWRLQQGRALLYGRWRLLPGRITRLPLKSIAASVSRSMLWIKVISFTMGHKLSIFYVCNHAFSSGLANLGVITGPQCQSLRAEVFANCHATLGESITVFENLLFIREAKELHDNLPRTL